MTGGSVRTMHCNPTRDPFGRPAHYCMVTKERFPLMSYRTMLNPNGGSQVSVPPQSGCLADRDASIAMIPLQLADVEVKVGHKLKVDLSKYPFWLTSIQLTDSSGTHKLYSFWDVCQTAAQCVFQLDRMKKEFTVTFFNADVFELEFFLEFEVIKLKVTVSPLEPVSVEFPPEPTASLNSTSTDSASTVSTWNFSAATPSSSDFWSTSETAPVFANRSEEEVVTVQLNETEPVQAVALRAIDDGSRVAASGVSTGTLFLTVVGLVFLAMVAVLVSTAIGRKKVAMGLRDPSLRLLSSEESSTL